MSFEPKAIVLATYKPYEPTQSVWNLWQKYDGFWSSPPPRNTITNIFRTIRLKVISKEIWRRKAVENYSVAWNSLPALHYLLNLFPSKLNLRLHLHLPIKIPLTFH